MSNSNYKKPIVIEVRIGFFVGSKGAQTLEITIHDSYHHNHTMIF